GSGASATHFRSEGRGVRTAHPALLGRASYRLLFEPDVLVAEAVIGAVRHRGQVLDPRVEAGRRTGVEDDRTRRIFLQLLVDLPNQLLALLDVGFGRLLVEQLLQLRIAIVRVVALRLA